MESGARGSSVNVAFVPFEDRELGRAISRAEREHDSEQGFDEPLWTTLPETTQIIGVTGPPGSGKSTLTDKLIACARNQKLSIGVIAIDPSSPFTGGAVLGDRLRMSRHAGDPGVFIRSMGSRTSLGGLAAAARSAVRLLAKNGAQVIVLETVGVGQAELDIMHVADTVVVVVVPGLGDTVQMNKAGIMEIGDTFVVNQADRSEAKRTKLELEQAILIGNHAEDRPRVSLTQATTGEGVTELWGLIRAHFDVQVTTRRLAARRMNGQRQEIIDRVQKKIVHDLRSWLAADYLQTLIDRKTKDLWNVNDLTTIAAREFLNRRGSENRSSES